MNQNNYRINNQIMNEQKFKNYVFGTGKVISVKDPMFLTCALETGEYVIGTSYNPFALQNVYHFKNNVFRVFNFTPGCNVEPLNIKLSYECDNITLDEVIRMIALHFLLLGSIISLRGDSDERKSVDDKIKSGCA